MSGIIGYGVYLPIYRIKTEEIASVWKKDPAEVIAGLRISEKSVRGFDEDAVTMGVEAGKRALLMAGISEKEVGCVYVGSESHPYAVNPTSTSVAEFLGIGNDYMAADLEFACKAATAGMQIVLGLLDSKNLAYGLVIGSDTAQSKPHDVLEYTAASAACAYILGNKKEDIIAEILETSSFSSDTPDFWRRDGQKFPSHFGRFSGEPAYFNHVFSEAKKLLKKSKMQPGDFSYCVFHMPNGKFPRIAAKKLGFSDQQIAPSLVVDTIGNPYSASALLGLTAVLDIAKPDEKIFFVSYGSGAGSDGFILQTTKKLSEKQKRGIPLRKIMEKKVYISYPEYLKKMHII
jgi:hydroxymethylglutaryl-CoA synthase